MAGGLLSLQGPSSNAFTNNVVVVVSSTIDVENVAATMGTLVIGSSTLTTTTTSNTPLGLTLGTVFLAGNPDFAPAANTSITLGDLNGAGTARDVTVRGAGTVIASGPAIGLISGSHIDIINGGTLDANNATALGTHSAVVLSNGGVLNLGANQIYATIGGTGTVSLDGDTLTVGGYNMNVSAASNDELTFTGAAPLSLTGTSLNLSYLGVAIPSQPYDPFTIISTAGGISGQFTQGTSISVGRVTYNIIYTGNAVELQVQTVIASPPTHLVVSASPTSAFTGNNNVTVTVGAQDANNQPSTLYTGASDTFTLDSYRNGVLVQEQTGLTLTRAAAVPSRRACCRPAPGPSRSTTLPPCNLRLTAAPSSPSRSAR